MFSNINNQINIIPANKTFSRGYRLDPSQYNVITERIIIKAKTAGIPTPTMDELNCIESIYLPNRFSRNYTGDSNIGTPMLGTSTMLNMRLPKTSRIFTDKQKDADKLFIQPNDILVSRSGTVGTSVLCGKSYEGFIASDHCLRVRINDKYRGYIAAYLRTKYGFPLLEKDAHGKVIKELVESNIRTLPVILFSEILDDVNDLMYRATNLYDEARSLFDSVEEKLLKCLENYIPKTIQPFQNIVPFSSLHANRLDPHMHDPYTNYLYHATENSKNYVNLCDVASIWGTSRFKRHYLPEDNPNGIGLYSSTDIVRANLFPSKYISRTLNAKDLKNCTIQKDTILVPCSGAYGGVLGHGMLAGASMDGKAVTQHVLRIARKDSTSINLFHYIAAFLCSDKYGYHLITSTRFGKDIPEIDINALNRILVPRIDENDENEIGSLFYQASLLQEEANELENAAIHLIESYYESKTLS